MGHTRASPVVKYLPGTRTTPRKVQYRLWYNSQSLGRTILVAGLLRMRGNPKAGLSEAIDHCYAHGFGRAIRGLTAEELARCAELGAGAAPALAEALAVARRAAGLPRATPSTEENRPLPPLAP